MNRKIIISFLLLISLSLGYQKMIIPMDVNQTNHLKAYGIAFSSLKNNLKVEWLLNYRGGSFSFAATKTSVYFPAGTSIRLTSFIPSLLMKKSSAVSKF